MIKLFFFLLPALFLPVLSNEQALNFVRQGDKAYEAGDYQDAKTHYAKAVNEGLVNPILYYNYGNTLFRLNELGKAILFYEKALKLKPTDPDIRANLRYANAQTIDKHPQPKQNTITRILWRIHGGYDINSALLLVLLFFALAFVFLVLMLYLPQKFRFAAVTLMILSVAALLLVLPSLILRIREQETVRFAIVLTPTLEIYSGPGESYQVLSKVHEGAKFEIEQTANNWAKVKLSNGMGGYVKFSELGKI